MYGSKSPRSALSLALATAIAASLVWAFWNTWAVDLSAIYFAAYSYAVGQPDLIYLSVPEFFGKSASLEWQDMAADMGHEGVVVTPYVYAPIWAAVLAPIAGAVGPAAFFNGALVVHAAALVGSAWCALRLVKLQNVPQAVPWLILLAMVWVLQPFQLAFWLNQPQILVTLIILAGFERYRAGHGIWAGVLLGLAAALKISPVLFGLLFLIDRRWDAALAMAATGLGLLAISVIVTGLPLHYDFIDQLSRAGGHVLINQVNFGLDPLIYRLADFLAGSGPWGILAMEIVPSHEWVAGLRYVLLIGALALIGLLPHTTLAGRVLALWSVSILCGPLGWGHYLIGPLILGLALCVAHRTGPRLILFAVAASLVSTPVRLVIIDLYDDPLGIMAAGAVSLICLTILGLLPNRATAP